MMLAKDNEICNSSAESHRIDLVAIEALPVVWPQILPLLIPSLDKFTAPESVYYTLVIGAAKLWVIHSEWIDGFVISGVYGEIGVITHCGGKDIKKWIHLLPTIEADFKSQGCGRWQMAGREGWGRLIDFDDKCFLYTKVLK